MAGPLTPGDADTGGPPVLQDGVPSLSEVLRAAAAPFALALVAGLACYAAAGASLGLLFGGVGFATLLAPPLVMAENRWLRQLLAGAVVIDGIAVAWLLPVFGGSISLGQWLACYVLLAAYVAALGALAVLLHRLRMPELGASAIATVVGLAWLTWPVWLAPWLHGSAGEALADWLIGAHPLMAINGVTPHLGIWSEHALAYRVMNLGQHVAYRLPSSVIPCVLVHALLAATILLLCRQRTCRNPVCWG